MTESLTPRRTDQGWIIDMPPEMARAAGVADGSMIVLYLHEGSVKAEILAPPTAELKASVRQIHEEFKDAFEEMKRLGD
jgi:hypothetical protein